MTTESKAGGPKGLAKRALGPFERRLDFIVERAVDRSMQQQSLAIQEALRADVATLVELTYELQRAVDQLTVDQLTGDQLTGDQLTGEAAVPRNA